MLPLFMEAIEVFRVGVIVIKINIRKLFILFPLILKDFFLKTSISLFYMRDLQGKGNIKNRNLYVNGVFFFHFFYNLILFCVIGLTQITLE